MTRFLGGTLSIGIDRIHCRFVFVFVAVCFTCMLATGNPTLELCSGHTVMLYQLPATHCLFSSQVVLSYSAQLLQHDEDFDTSSAACWVILMFR